MMPTKAGTFCQPHRERAGVQVAASIIVGGTAFCRACFDGQSPPKSFAQKPQAARSNGGSSSLNKHDAMASRYPGRREKAPWAIAIAKLFPQPGLGGTGNLDPGWLRARGKFSRNTLRVARVVVRHSGELADQVAQGSITLMAAYRIVQKKYSLNSGNTSAPYTHVEGRKLGRKGRQAIELAKAFPWTGRGGDREAARACEAERICRKYLTQARELLRHAPELAEAVARGEMGLNVASAIVRRARQEAQRRRMLQAAGRFRMQPYVRPRGVF
jgi:hypothetical protein